MAYLPPTFLSAARLLELVRSSGKSTIFSLIERFYNLDPEIGGEILLDGRRITEYNIATLRKIFGVVEQEPRLFGTSGEGCAVARTRGCVRGDSRCVCNFSSRTTSSMAGTQVPPFARTFFWDQRPVPSARKTRTARLMQMATLKCPPRTALWKRTSTRYACLFICIDVCCVSQLPR